MSRLGKGYIPSPPDKIGLGHPHHLLGAAAPPPPAAAALIGPPVDQMWSSSCTGNAFAVVVQAAQTKILKLPAGIWSPLPSRLQLYFDGRALEDSTGQDVGAMISDLVEAARVVGIAPESIWPFDMGKVTTQPDAAVYRAAADQKIFEGAYRIITGGQQRIQDIKTAIAADHLVMWGTQLDQAFEDLQPGDVWPGVTGPVIGGHAMVLHEYTPAGFKTRSSWGDWCDGGSAWVADAAVMASAASDFWIVAVVDPFASEVA